MGEAQKLSPEEQIRSAREGFDGGQDFTFPSFLLNSGAEVRVYTNRDIPGSFSFNRGSAIWNNDGDTARLQNSLNKVIDFCTYKPVAGRAGVAC